MTYLILLLVFSALISIATIFVIDEPGYVFVQWSHWQVETSLILVIAVAFMAVIVLSALLQVIIGLFGIPGRIGKSYQEYKDARRLTKTGQGLESLLLGDWLKAEKNLDSVATDFPEPVFNYLAAAYAAEKRGDADKREHYLKRAGELGGDHKHLVSLVNCRFQIARGEYEDAVVELQKLGSYLPNNPIVFGLLAEVYEKTKDWTALDQLRPHLQKSQALSVAELRSLNSLVLQQRLRAAETASELLKVWKSLSNHEQNKPDTAVSYVRKLLEFDRHQEADKVIRAVLGRTWVSELAYLYGLVGGGMSRQYLYDTAQKWLKDHPEDPDLLLTAAKFARRIGNVDEACRYFRAAVNSGGRPEAAEELGNLLLEQNRGDEALDLFHRALTGTRH